MAPVTSDAGEDEPEPNASSTPAKAQPNTLARCQVAQRMRTLRSRSGGAPSAGTRVPRRRCRKIRCSPSTEWTTPVSAASTPATRWRLCTSRAGLLVRRDAHDHLLGLRAPGRGLAEREHRLAVA